MTRLASESLEGIQSGLEVIHWWCTWLVNWDARHWWVDVAGFLSIHTWLWVGLGGHIIVNRRISVFHGWHHRGSVVGIVFRWRKIRLGAGGVDRDVSTWTAIPTTWRHVGRRHIWGWLLPLLLLLWRRIRIWIYDHHVCSFRHNDWGRLGSINGLVRHDTPRRRDVLPKTVAIHGLG